MLCLDSDCGIVDAGGWALEYDSGSLAGPGDAFSIPYRATPELRCTFETDDRVIRLAIYTWPADTTQFPPYLAGSMGATAATELSPGSGLYLEVSNSTEVYVAEFIRAVATLRVN